MNGSCKEKGTWKRERGRDSGRWWRSGGRLRWMDKSVEAVEKLKERRVKENDREGGVTNQFSKNRMGKIAMGGSRGWKQ